MSTRAARRLFVAFFGTYAIALTWPGLLPFNRARPFVLGLPFSLFWVALWVVLGFAALLLVDHAERRARARAEAATPPAAEEI